MLQQQAAFTSCMPSCRTSVHSRDGSLHYKADKEAQHSMFASLISSHPADAQCWSTLDLALDHSKPVTAVDVRALVVTTQGKMLKLYV
jgi:hypothetical protein